MSSDLLPLIAAVLNDKVAADAHEELAQLQRELQVARAIEICAASSRANGNENDDEEEEVVVYASAQFEQGCYGANPNLWEVPLESKLTCRLVDLRSCLICVGGGFTVESLDEQLSNRTLFESFLDPDDGDGDNSKGVQFCFSPNSLWLSVVIHGWPRSEWELTLKRASISRTEE